MANRSGLNSEFVFPVVLAVGLPVMIVGQKLAMGEALPMQAVAVMLGAYATGLVWAGISLTLPAEAEAGRAALWEAMAEPIARERLPALELLDTVPYSVVPATVGVVDGTGDCPWGLKVHDTLEVDPRGGLSSPLCRAAVMALRPALNRLAEGGEFDTPVSCRCPLADRRLTFRVQASESLAAS